MDESASSPWILEERLGRGSQGVTWRARHAETGRVVALKVFRLADADDWKAHELFRRECEVLARLDHPGIPRYVDHGHDDERGELHLATDLFDGRSLAARRAGGATFTTGELYGILRQVLDVLAYLHAQRPPVIHRDIKPSNLLIDAHGRVVLIDFGSVRTALRPEGGSTVVGTFGFMAPEQLHGQASPATDVYGLGVTLATLATGVDAEQLPRRGLRIDLDAVMEAGPLRGLLARMTAPDPDERLASVADVRAAMERRSAPPSVMRALEAGRNPPRGLLGLVWRILLFAAWLGLTVTDAVLGVVEKALPLSHRRKQRLIERRLRRDPDRRDTKLDRLDARHDRAMRAVRATRDNLRVITDKSEPYPAVDNARSRPPKLPDKGSRRRGGR